MALVASFVIYVYGWGGSVIIRHVCICKVVEARRGLPLVLELGVV